MDALIDQFLARDAHPAIQFIKYAIGGGIATSVDILAFYLLSWKLIPALREDDPIVRRLGLSVTHVEENRRPRRFVINSAIAFVFSNLTAYLINIHWVFQPGRYAWYTELALFYAVSGISIFLGTLLGWIMIRVFHMSTTASYLGKIVSALLINFVCRKFIIFKG
jgi:putative flippase GtrA